MENEVVVVVGGVVFQHLNLNDEIHFHYVHVMIVLGHLIERDLHGVTSKKNKKRNDYLIEQSHFHYYTWSGLAANAAKAIGSNRAPLANINAINSRSRDILCIASRLDNDDGGGGGPPGCNNGPPWERPKHHNKIDLFKNVLPERGLANDNIGGGGGGGGIVGPFELFDDGDESLLLPKWRCVCEWEWTWEWLCVLLAEAFADDEDELFDGEDGKTDEGDEVPNGGIILR